MFYHYFKQLNMCFNIISKQTCYAFVHHYFKAMHMFFFLSLFQQMELVPFMPCFSECCMMVQHLQNTLEMMSYHYFKQLSMLCYHYFKHLNMFIFQQHFKLKWN